MSTENNVVCECGREFDTERALSIHKTTGHDKPYTDEETLRQEYVENGKSTIELGEEWSCDSKTILNWINRFGIEKRETKEYNRVERVKFRMHNQGYEMWSLNYGEDRGKTVYVHRLLAVAEYGINALQDGHVHHKNRIPWFNTPENIEIKDPKDHAREHYENGDLELEPGGISEMMNKL